ncbi:MarR family transcriptional regulator [Alisedimentitalea sp. MJ-SS2]|uniref:MarR family winged helix-turn-helix transcriptional regulator n=1 Tax=Aliisedimentitalea sp. MJ-SS2 TaxID=3049795 RepID=UPI00290AF0E6|nr:MarR family transcriptional regulator [Alisedimentitalea sp. MJ-SS2]MDU8926180.1 MarR family transcriptional regulator [Alisedimentitalea sp. MJ-SS2]
MHDALIPEDDVDDFIIVRATGFTSKVQRIVARDVLRGENLPVLEWRLLFSVARFGSCHLAFITRRTSIDPAHGSRAATALEKKGYIERRDDPANRRRKVISLTPSGVELFERIWPRAQQAIKQITDQLTRKDFHDLKRLLDLVNDVAGPLADAKNQKPDTKDKSQENDTVAAHA